VQVVFHNTDQADTFVVEPGMRIAQLVVLAVPALALVEGQELAASERGERGFGSSRA
jgi:dUTP diphosphatase